MADRSALPGDRARPRAIHVMIGVLLVLWNGFGLAGSIAAQSGAAPAMDEASAAIFQGQPLWYMLVVDLGPAAGLAGAVALLLQHRAAVWLFAAQVAVLVLANAYELAAGTSILLRDSAALVPTIVVTILFVAQIAYARWLRQRGLIY